MGQQNPPSLTANSSTQPTFIQQVIKLALNYTVFYHFPQKKILIFTKIHASNPNRLEREEYRFLTQNQGVQLTMRRLSLKTHIKKTHY
jgi:hypothetical protein